MKPIAKIRLRHHTDVVEFASRTGMTDFLAVGRYQVANQAKTKREGGVSIFKYKYDDDNTDKSTL